MKNAVIGCDAPLASPHQTVQFFGSLSFSANAFIKCTWPIFHCILLIKHTVLTRSGLHFKIPLEVNLFFFFGATAFSVKIECRPKTADGADNVFLSYRCSWSLSVGSILERKKNIIRYCTIRDFVLYCIFVRAGSPCWFTPQANAIFKWYSTQ